MILAGCYQSMHGSSGGGGGRSGERKAKGINHQFKGKSESQKVSLEADSQLL